MAVCMSIMAGEKAKIKKIYEDAKELFERVKTGTDDIDLILHL